MIADSEPNEIPVEAGKGSAGGVAWHFVRRVVRGTLFLGLGLVACPAAVLIVALLASFGYAQVGPGGVLSDIRTGRPAPDFELPTLAGDKVRLSDFRGRPVLLSFWATFCPQCAEQLPLVAAAESDYAELRLAVIALNSGQSPEHVRRYLKRRGISLRVALDPDKAVYRAYRIVGLPTTLWIDAQGIVRAVELGKLEPALIERNLRRTVSTTTPTIRP